MFLPSNSAIPLLDVCFEVNLKENPADEAVLCIEVCDSKTLEAGKDSGLRAKV